MEFFDLIWLGVTGVGSVWGYLQSRRRRWRRWWREPR
jgi:hypothetical protein